MAGTPFEPWITGLTTTHKAIGPVYLNTALSTTEAGPTSNATMTIYLRLHMVPIGGNEAIFDVDTKRVSNRQWGALEFLNFKNKCRDEAESFWNDNTVTLITPKNYRGLNWPAQGTSTHRLNVNCRLKIVWANGPGDAHHVIRCARLTSDSANSTAFRSDWEHYDSGDTKAAMFNNLRSNCGAAIAVEHFTVPHEIGHAIGLPHVGTFHDLTKSEYQCKVPGINPGTANWSSGGKDPYGNFSTEDEIRNIMGYGQRKSLWNFMPWIHRISPHTRFECSLVDWRFSLQNVPPSVL